MVGTGLENLLYLQAPAEVLIDRIRRGGRPQEAAVSMTYGQQLVDAYTTFFHRYDRSPLLSVNAAEFNPAERGRGLRPAARPDPRAARRSAVLQSGPGIGGIGSPRGRLEQCANPMHGLTISNLARMKAAGEKIAVLTAYDFPFARIMDQAGIDIVLVGDSAGVVTAGYETTLPVTMDEMLYHTRAVVRGVSRALVVADMAGSPLPAAATYCARVRA